jgi:hypothetical protein
MSNYSAVALWSLRGALPILFAVASGSPEAIHLLTRRRLRYQDCFASLAGGGCFPKMSTRLNSYLNDIKTFSTFSTSRLKKIRG